MKRHTKQVLKDCTEKRMKDRKKIIVWSNARAEKIDPDSAYEAVNDLVRTRCPFPLALYENSKKSGKAEIQYASRLRSCGYSIPFHFDAEKKARFGVNPDRDAITNICTAEQALHLTGLIPPLGLSHDLS